MCSTNDQDAPAYASAPASCSTDSPVSHILCLICESKFHAAQYLHSSACRNLSLHCCPLQDISRFLRHPRKPAILAMSRPDAKKNITTLVKAFGQNPMLRELSNLVLVMVRLLPLFVR